MHSIYLSIYPGRIMCVYYSSMFIVGEEQLGVRSKSSSLPREHTQSPMQTCFQSMKLGTGGVVPCKCQ